MNKFLPILFLIACSCVTQKKCLERYPPSHESHSDSIVYREKIVYRDTIIKVKIPGDTIEVQQDLDSILMPIIAESKYAKAITQIYKNKLKITLIQKETEIAFKLDSAFKQTEYWKEKWTNDKQTIINTVKYIPDIYKIALWVWIGVFLVIILYVLYKIFKPKLF